MRPEGRTLPPCRAGRRNRISGKNAIVPLKGKLAIASEKGEAVVVKREAEQ
jgi:hypothetical protein